MLDLKQIAEGGAFDVTAAIRLLALKVAMLNGELPAVTMDAPEAGATLDSAAPAKKGKAKKEAEPEAGGG